MRLFLFTSLLMITTCIWAKHPVISHFDEIKIELISKDTLVVTDINDTLVSCFEPLWQKSTWKAMSKDVTSKLSNLSVSNKNLFANLVLQKCTNVEIAGSRLFLSTLKTKGIQSMALTAAVSVPLDGVDMEQAVVNSMNDLQIEFNMPTIKSDAFVKLAIDSMSLAKPHLNPKGIVFTNGSVNKKGDVLEAIIGAMKEKPKKVLFFDDSIEHLDSVSSTGKKLGITIEVYQVVATPKGIEKPTERETRIVESLLDRSRLGAGS